jgi:WD40 repeat protein
MAIGVNHFATGERGKCMISWRLPCSGTKRKTRTGLAAEMRGHTSKVLHVPFRPDGARLLTASADGTGRQWDVTTGREVEPPYERHTGEVLAATFSPDGRLGPGRSHLGGGGPIRSGRAARPRARRDRAGV